MAKFDIYHSSQDAKEELLPFFELTFNSGSNTYLRSEGENYTITENLEDLDVSKYLDKRLYWDLVNIKQNMGKSSVTLSADVEKRAWGRVTNVNSANELRFLPSVSESDFDFQYTKKYWDDGTLDNSAYIVPGAGNDKSVLFCKRIDPTCLVVDLTDAPDPTYKYSIMGHLDVACNLSDHAFRLGYRVMENDDPQSLGHYSSELYCKSRYTSRVGEKVHWQGVLPIELRGGRKYRISICVEHDILDESSPSDNCREGAVLSLSNGVMHAIRIDGSSYAAIGNGQDALDTTSAGTRTSHSFGPWSAAIGTTAGSHSIVRRVGLSIDNLFSGKYLVAFSGSITKGSGNTASKSREIGVSVALGHRLTSAAEYSSLYDTYDTLDYIVNNSWVQLRDDRDSVSVGGIAVLECPNISTVAYLSQSQVDSGGTSSTLYPYKKELVISLIGNASDAPVKLENYSLVAIKILNNDNSIQNQTFESLEAVQSPYRSNWEVAGSYSDEGFYREVDLNDGAVDTWKEVPIDYLQAGEDTVPLSVDQPYMQYVSDYILNATDDGKLAGAPDASAETTSQDNVTVAKWNNTSGKPAVNADGSYVTESGYSNFDLFPASTGGSNVTAVNNAIAGYTAVKQDTSGYLSIGPAAAQASTGGSASGDINLGQNWTAFFVAKLSIKNSIGTARAYQFMKSNGTSPATSGFSYLYISITPTGQNNTAAPAVSNTHEQTIVYFYTNGQYKYIRLDTEAALILKQDDWHMFTFRREGNTYYFYLDGRLAGSVDVHSSGQGQDDNFKRVFNSNVGQLAELVVFKGALTERDISFHHKRLTDKFQVVQYLDQARAQSSPKSISELTYSSSGKYLEIASHQGARYSDDNSKKFTVFSFAPDMIAGSAGSSFNDLSEIKGIGQASGVSWIGARYASGTSITMGSYAGSNPGLDGYGSDFVEVYIEYSASEADGKMTPDEYSSLNLGDVYELVISSDSPLGPYKLDLSGTTGEGKNSIEIQLHAKSDKATETGGDLADKVLYHLKFRRTYAASDTLPYRAERWVGSSAAANLYKDYIRKVSAANQAPVVRAVFEGEEEQYKKHLPVTLTVNDGILSNVDVGFGEAEPDYEFKYTPRGLRADVKAGDSTSGKVAGQNSSTALQYSGKTAEFDDYVLGFPGENYGFVWGLLNEDIDIDGRYWTESIANKVSTAEDHLLGKAYSYASSSYLGLRDSPTLNQAKSSEGHTLSTMAWAGWANEDISRALTGASQSGARGKFSDKWDTNRTHPVYGLVRDGTITTTDLDGESWFEVNYTAGSSMFPKIDLPIWDMMGHANRHIKEITDAKFPPAERYSLTTSASSEVVGYMGTKENEIMASTHDLGKITLDKEQRMLRMAVYSSAAPGTGETFTYCIYKTGTGALEGSSNPNTTVTISGSNRKAWVEFTDNSPYSTPFFNSGDSYSVRVTASAGAATAEHEYFIVAQSPVNRLSSIGSGSVSTTSGNDDGSYPATNLVDGSSSTKWKTNDATALARVVFDINTTGSSAIVPASLKLTSCNATTGTVKIIGADDSALTQNVSSTDLSLYNASSAGYHIFHLSGTAARRYWAIEFGASSTLGLGSTNLEVAEVSLEAGHVNSTSYTYDDGYKIYHGGWADAWLYPSDTKSPTFSSANGFKSLVFDGVDDQLRRDSGYAAIQATNRIGSGLQADRTYHGGYWIVAKLASDSSSGIYPFISYGGGTNDQGITYNHNLKKFRVTIGTIRTSQTPYNVGSPIPLNATSLSDTNPGWSYNASNGTYEYSYDMSWYDVAASSFSVWQRSSTSAVSRNPSYSSSDNSGAVDHSAHGSYLSSSDYVTISNTTSNPPTSNNTWYFDSGNNKIIVKLDTSSTTNLEKDIYIKGYRWQDPAHWNSVDIDSEIEVSRDEWHVFGFSVSYTGKVTAWVDDVKAGEGVMPGGGMASHLEVPSFPTMIDVEDEDRDSNVAERRLIARSSGYGESSSGYIAYFGRNGWDYPAGYLAYQAGSGDQNSSTRTLHYFKGELAEVRVWSDHWNSAANTTGDWSLHADEVNLKTDQFRRINQRLMEKFMVPQVGGGLSQWINEGRALGDGLVTQDDFRFHNSASTKPVVVSGPNGYNAVGFSPSSNYGDSHDAMSLYNLLNQSPSAYDPSTALGDNFAWTVVIKFDKKETEWRHPILGNAGGAPAPTLFEFVSQDASGNGYINCRTRYSFEDANIEDHPAGEAYSEELYHEVRADVKIDPGEWHVLTLVRNVNSEIDGGYKHKFRVYLNGEELLNVRGTDQWQVAGTEGAQSIERAVPGTQSIEYLGRMNNTSFSGAIADMRGLSTGTFKYLNKNGIPVHTKQSIADAQGQSSLVGGSSIGLRSSISDEEIRAMERIVANKYNITHHKLYKNNYGSTPKVPKVPFGTEMWVHLKAGLETLELADDGTPFNSPSLVMRDGSPVAQSEQVVETWKDVSGNSNDFTRVRRHILDYPTDTSGYHWALLSDNIIVGLGLWQESHLPLWSAAKSSQELGSLVPYVEGTYLPYSGGHTWPARYWGAWGTKASRTSSASTRSNPLYSVDSYLTNVVVPVEGSQAAARALKYKGLKDAPSRHNLSEIEETIYGWDKADRYGQAHPDDSAGEYFSEDAYISSTNLYGTPVVNTEASADGGKTKFKSMIFRDAYSSAVPDHLVREWEFNDVRAFVNTAGRTSGANTARYNRLHWGAISVAAKLEHSDPSVDDQVYPFLTYGTTVNTNTGFFYKHNKSTGKGNFRLRLSPSMITGSDQAEYYNFGSPYDYASNSWELVGSSTHNTGLFTQTSDYRISLTDLGFAVDASASNWQTRIHEVWSDYSAGSSGTRTASTSRVNHGEYGSAKPGSGGLSLTKDGDGWDSTVAWDATSGTPGPNQWTVYADGGEAYLKVRLSPTVSSPKPTLLIQGDRWTNDAHYNEIDITSSVEISMDEWHVFTVGWRHEGVVYVYVDGVLAGTATIVGGNVASYFTVDSNIGKKAVGTPLSNAGIASTSFNIKSLGRGVYEHPDGWKKYNGISGYSSNTVDEASVSVDYFNGEIAEVRVWNDSEKYDGWDTSTDSTNGYGFQQSLFDLASGNYLSDLVSMDKIDKALREKFNIGTIYQPKYVANAINGYGAIKFQSNGKACFQRTSHPTANSVSFSDLSNSDIFAVIKIDTPWQSGPLFRLAKSTVGLGENTEGHQRDQYISQSGSNTNISTFKASVTDSNGETGRSGSSVILYHGEGADVAHRWLPRNQVVASGSVSTQNDIGTLGAGSYVLSLHYDSNRRPTIKINGRKILEYGSGYEAPASIGSFADWFIGGVGLVGSNNAHTDTPSSHEDIGYFDGYISEFLAYGKNQVAGAAGLSDSDRDDVLKYLSDKYNIEVFAPRSSNRSMTSSSNTSLITPLGASHLSTGSAISREYGMTSGFYLSYGDRYEGDPKLTRFELAATPEGAAKGYSSARVYDPSYIWVKESPGIAVTPDTNVDIMTEVEFGRLYKRTWAGPTATSSNTVSGSWTASSYKLHLPDALTVSRVLRNGEEIPELDYLSITDDTPSWGTNKSNIWYWDSENKYLHLLMGAEGTSPNDDSQNVLVYEKKYYGREGADITQLGEVNLSSSTSADPTGSDSSVITTSAVTDKSISGEKQIPYEPRVSQVPGYTQAVQDSGSVANVSTTLGSLGLINSDGEFSDDSGSKIYEGGRAKVYRGFPDEGNDERDLELIFDSVQGSPSTQADGFNMTLFDDIAKLTDPLAQVSFENNTDTGSQTAYSAVDWPILFGNQRRAPAYRVSNLLHKGVDSGWGTENYQIFKVCDHPISINSDGVVSTVTTNTDPDTGGASGSVSQTVTTGLAIYLNQDSEYAFRGSQSLIITDQALTRCGMFAIARSKAAFLDVNKLDGNEVVSDANQDAEDFFLSQTLYVDVVGKPKDSAALENVLLSGGLYGPGAISRFLLESYPKITDEEVGHYSTTTNNTSPYQPQIITSSVSQFLSYNYSASLKLADNTDFSQIPILGKVKLIKLNEPGKFIHATVLDKNASSKTIVIQPQFVVGDVRLDQKTSGGAITGISGSGSGNWLDVFTNKSDTTFESGSTLIVYEKSIGINTSINSRFNLDSFIEVDRHFRKKQATNAIATETVRYGKNDASIVIMGSSSLTDALNKVSEQFFTYWYFDRTGRAAIGVLDLEYGNLLENSGIEANDINRGNMNSNSHTRKKIAFPWKSVGSNPLGTGDVETARIFEGKQSLIVKSGIRKGYIEQPVYLSEGKYAFSITARAGGAGAASAAGISALVPGRNGAEIKSEPKPLDSGDWTRINLVFDVDLGCSGIGFVRVYPDIEEEKDVEDEVQIIVDNLELYKIAAVISDQNAMIGTISQDPDGFYAAKVFYDINPRTGGANAYQLVKDSEAFGVGLSASQSRSAFETAGILEFTSSNSSDKDSATEISGRALGYYSRPRQEISVEIMGVANIPKIGDWVFFDRDEISKTFMGPGDSPFARVKEIDYSANESSNSVSSTVERQIDFVTDRDSSSVGDFPIGGIVLCTGSACPPGFDDITKNYMNSFLGAPDGSEVPDLNLSKGNYTHSHTATHGHEVNPHSHSVTINLSDAAQVPRSGGSRQAYVAHWQTLAGDPTPEITGNWIFGDEARNYNRNSYGKHHWVGMSSHSHATASNSTTTSGFSGFIESTGDKGSITTVTKTGSNFYSHVNVRLCRRAGELYKETSAGTFSTSETTKELPSTIICGYSDAITSLPTSFAKATSIYQGSDSSMAQANTGLIRCTGILNSPITSSYNLIVSNPDGGALYLSSYNSATNLTRNTTQKVRITIPSGNSLGNLLEAGKRVWFQANANDSTSRVHAVIHAIGDPLNGSDTQRDIEVEPLNELFIHNGVTYSDKSVRAYPEDTSVGEDISGWMLLADDSSPGKVLDNSGYGILHAHSSTSILIPHTHRLAHSHSVSASANSIFTGYATNAYNNTEILYHGFVPSWAMNGEGPYTIVAGIQYLKDQVVTGSTQQDQLYAHTSSTLLLQYSYVGNSRDYNNSRYSYPPINHRHSLRTNNISTNLRMHETDSASGVATGDLYAKQLEDNSNSIGPPMIRMHWLHPNRDVANNLTTDRKTDVPTGAIIFFEGASCPAGYVRFEAANNYLFAAQVSDALGFSVESLNHYHNFSADGHDQSGVNHGHSQHSLAPSGGAVVLAGDGNYSYYKSSLTSVTSFTDVTGTAFSVPSPMNETELISGGLFPNENPNDYLKITGKLDHWAPGPHITDVDSPPTNIDDATTEGAHTHNMNASFGSAKSYGSATTGQKTRGAGVSAGGFDLGDGNDETKPKYRELLACKRN